MIYFITAILCFFILGLLVMRNPKHLAGLFVVFMTFVMIGLKLWFLGSLLLSGIKAATNNCNKSLVAEAVVSGDWFCPENEETKK